MENKERTRQQEELYLQETLAIAEKELQTIQKSIEDMEAEMQKEKLEAEGHTIIQKGRKNLEYFVKGYENVLFDLREADFSLSR